MRKYQMTGGSKGMKMLVLDDDLTIALTIQSYFSVTGYEVDVENNPLAAIERVRKTHYDILLLDFLMTPICGDKVIEIIREFDTDIFIILLTGHRSMAPPVKTIRTLNIQGYFEKSDQFDQLELLVESCVKSITQLNIIREYRNSLETANMQLVEVNRQLQSHYDDMLNTLRSVVDARDIYTRGHSDRVSILAEKISKMMGRNEEEHSRIKTTGLFHDIGKIKVPDNILLKEGKLTENEKIFILDHPQYAVDIISNMSMLTDIVPGVLQHHERYDGKGYPLQLSANEICEDARIIGVADSFDAMTSFRRYRENMSVDQAEKEIKAGKGTQFDPDVVDAFFDTMSHFDEIKEDENWSNPIIDKSGKTK